MEGSPANTTQRVVLRAFGRALLALGVGCLLAWVVAGPDRAAYNNAIPGYSNTDHTGAVYLHHQFIEAVSAGRSPAFDPNQLYPVGTSLLALNGSNSLEMVVSWVLHYWLAWPAWFSWAHLAWIPLNTLAFLPLGRHLWGRTMPAVMAGGAWAVLPYYVGELAAGRLTQIALVGLPIAVLGLLRLSEGRGDRWAPFLAGLGLALTGLGYWFYAVFLVVLMPMFLGWAAWHRRSEPRRWLFDYVLAGLTSIVLVAPFVAPLVMAKLSGGYSPAPPMDPTHSTPIFENALQLSGQQPIQLRGWLPYVLVPGALWTVWRGERRILWAGLALTAVLFALGPVQAWNGMHWHLPYELLWRSVPLLDRLTHPGRWLGVGGLFLVVWAADGLARGPGRGLATALLPVGVVAQLYVFGNLPMGTWMDNVPRVWRAVSETSVPGAVIVVPLLNSPLSCRWQVLHKRPLLGGMVEALPWAWPPAFREYVEASPFLMGSYELSYGRQGPPPLYQEDLDQLHASGFGLVVLDRRAWRNQMGTSKIEVEPRMSEVLGAPLFSDESGAVWALPTVGSKAPMQLPSRRLPEP